MHETAYPLLRRISRIQKQLRGALRFIRLNLNEYLYVYAAYEVCEVFHFVPRLIEMSLVIVKRTSNHWDCYSVCTLVLEVPTGFGMFTVR